MEDDAHITLSFDPEYVQEGQTNVQVTLTATRDGTVGDHTVDWSVATATTQTATDGTDYTNPGRGSCGGSRNNDYFIRVHPSDVRIKPGATSASTTVTYNICSDDLDDPNETIIWTATASHATFNEAVLTIGDPETITLSVSPDTIAENAGATEATVTATMSAARATDTVVRPDAGRDRDGPGGLHSDVTDEHHHPQGADHRHGDPDHHPRRRRSAGGRRDHHRFGRVWGAAGELGGHHPYQCHPAGAGDLLPDRADIRHRRK